MGIGFLIHTMASITRTFLVDVVSPKVDLRR